MTLREYLKESGMTLAQFAVKVGAHPITVHDWAAGKAIPRRERMTAIEAATDGKVGAASFYPSPQPQPERAA